MCSQRSQLQKFLSIVKTHPHNLDRTRREAVTFLSPLFYDFCSFSEDERARIEGTQEYREKWLDGRTSRFGLYRDVGV